MVFHGKKKTVVFSLLGVAVVLICMNLASLLGSCECEHRSQERSTGSSSNNSALSSSSPSPSLAEENKNKMKPFVSFIIPTVMRDTLGRTIASLLNQTDSDWEAIIGIDVQKVQSSLSNHDAIPPYQDDPRIRFMLVASVDNERGRSDNGAGKIRNQMIFKAAQGEWVAFVDDDDTLSPQYVEWLKNSLPTDASNTPVDLILFRMAMYVNGAKRIENQFRKLPPTGNVASIGRVGISFACRRDLFLPPHNLTFGSAYIEDYNFLKQVHDYAQRQQSLQQQSDQDNDNNDNKTAATAMRMIPQLKIADCVGYYVKDLNGHRNESDYGKETYNSCNLTDLIVRRKHILPDE